MKIYPYLNFDGNCQEAFEFYAKVFGGKILGIQKYGDAPAGEEINPTWNDRVMHAQMSIGDAMLMASDTPPDWFHKPQGIYVFIQIDEVADAERIFEQLSEGAEIHMPMQEQFWAKRFGMLVDKYGTPWMISGAVNECQ